MVNSIARTGSMKTALVLALTLASANAAALGLGQLELKSKLGEPLLAEIAIVSSDPEELEQLRAGLASPETFARVGLRPPDAIVARLRFEPVINAAGDAVIRVTSAQPIDQAVLTFLIEVDWGQGRLVREYSTLLDAPRTVSAPLQPPIQAPVLAPSNAIVRAPQIASQVAPAIAPAVAPVPVAPVAVPVPPPAPAPVAVPVPPPAPAPAPVRSAPVAAAPPAKPAPVAAVAVPAPPAAPRPAAADARPAPSRPVPESSTVARGETLSQIAGRLDLGVSLDQAMVALLRANPDAFINDNINLLKQGAVLRVPQPAQLDGIGRAEASAIVRAQAQQWRQPRPAVAQPVADSGARASAVVPPERSAPTATATAGARLEIIPPGASRATRAGTQSGISAGGEGDMLRQELQQTRETLAAREAELAEMQSRLAELEKLQGDQSQLLSMKDSELAAAQQRLATSQQAAPPPADAARNTALPWVLGGVALLLALLAGWALRRRNAATPKFRAPPAAPRPSIADAFAPAAVLPAQDEAAQAGLSAIPAVPASSGAGVAATGQAAGIQDDPLPFWDRREQPPRPGGRTPPAPATPAPASTATPAWHDPKSANAAITDQDVATAILEVPGQERLDLARAYLDLGDHESARLLLTEVAAGGDAEHSRQASRMLRELE